MNNKYSILNYTNPVNPPVEGNIPKENIPVIDPSKDKVKPKTKVRVADQDNTKYVLDFAGKTLPVDNRKVSDVISEVSKQMKIDPSFLLKSSYQEGMPLIISKPDTVSEAWINERNRDNSISGYPIDGFYNYGLDFFGSEYNNLKKYLPKDFENTFKPYSAVNEKGEKVLTAAFKTNKDALMAKAAYLRSIEDKVNEYSNKHNLPLNDTQKKYFIAATYNGGWGNGRKMLDEFAVSKNKDNYVNSGETRLKQIHKHIMPRVSNLDKLKSLFPSTEP
jgi:hypothetical protein